MVQSNPEGFPTASTYPVDDVARDEHVLTDRRRPFTVSWGAVIAGVMTFLAVTVVLSLVSVGIGLGGSGIGAGIWGIIALALALAAGGYVTGVLAVQRGALHGFLTWATSLIVALGLTVWLSASLLGAVGGMVSSVAQAVSGTDATEVAEQVEGNVDDEDAQNQADKTIEDAKDTASDVADTAQASAWWGFAGLLIGAGIAAGAGMVGSRRSSDATDHHSGALPRA